MAKAIASKTATKKVVKKAATKTAVKKAATKASARKATPEKKKKEIKIKYSDKSEGQPELVPIFEHIKKMLLPYVKGSLELVGGYGGMLCLVSQKPVVIEGRKKDEMWFAGILVQKGYVGFYYMPVYANPDMKKVFKPELLKCLKGKSCFHIKKNDPVIMEQIKESLKIGYEMYKERGWL
jgi:hypothetical protein